MLLGTSPLGHTGPTSSLPLVIIEMPWRDLSSGGRFPVSMAVINPANGNGASAGQIGFMGRASLGIRGNSSRVYRRKSYRLELQDQIGADRKAALCGLPAESDWILYASATDPTFIRDCLTYQLWREMGYYAPHTSYVEVFIRTNSGTRPSFVEIEHLSTNDYAGLYVLIEKIKRGRNRVNIERLEEWNSEEPDVSGGYIIKKDEPRLGDRSFVTSLGERFLFDEPKPHDVTTAQERWLTNYVNAFERALMGSRFRNPTNGYVKYINVESFIDYYWMIEMTRNTDGFWSNLYFYKERGGKLNAGPVWDWDLSFGNDSRELVNNMEGWRWNLEIRGGPKQWFDRLFDDPDFLQRYIDRWHELRKDVFATSNVLTRVDLLASQIREAQARTNERWRSIAKPIKGTGASLGTYTEHVQWLKKWITTRLAWIDTQFLPLPTVRISKDSPKGFDRLTISAEHGRVFYTLDGSDPRARGGFPRQGALEYTNSVQIPSRATLTARVYKNSRFWSAPVVTPIHSDEIRNN